MQVINRALKFSRTIVTGFLILLIISWFAAPALAKVQSSKHSSQKKHLTKHKPEKKHADKKKKARPASRGIQAKAAYCLNLRSNETLLARNADEQLPVASLTKLVTAMVTLDHMPLDRKVTVPDHIKKIPKSVVGLKAGDEITVEDLLHGLLIGSGNDCAETLACAFPGGKKAFVAAMNKKVRSMGMRKTRFYTPSGLDLKSGSGTEDSEEVDSNVSTAREIASIARSAFSNSVVRSICLKKSYVLAGVNDKTYPVKTTNKLLRDNLPLIGGKTGYTCRAGHCLATEFTPGRNAFLIVVLGSPDHFRDTRLLYHKALKETTRIKLAPTDTAPKRIASQK
jgi:D-alanyl-D-alanine carboxypeptidase